MQGLQNFFKLWLNFSLLLSLIGFQIQCAGAAEPILITENTEELNLTAVADYFEDHNGVIRVTDLETEAYEHQFLPVNADTFNVGITRSVIWLRFELRYLSYLGEALGQWLIQVGHTPLDLVTLYSREQDGEFQVVHTGDKYKYELRSIAHPSFLFPIELDSGESKRFYMRIETSSAMLVPLKLWSPLAYLERSTLENMLTGGVLGVLLIMLAFSLAQLLFFGGYSYLFFAAYLGSFLLYLLSVNGTGLAFLWPDFPVVNSASPFFMSVFGVSGLIFARTFLQLGERLQWLDWFFLLIIMAGMLMMPVSLLIHYGIAANLVMAQLIVSVPIIVITGIYFWWRDRQSHTGLFSIAFVTLLVSGGTYLAIISGILPFQPWVVAAVLGGLVIHVMLLSLGLSLRTRGIRDKLLNREKKLRKKITAAKSRLQESNRLKGEFLQAISRELSNPINQMSESLENLTEVGSLDDHRKALDAVRRSSGKMNLVVSHLLTLADFQSGDVSVANNPFHLHKQLEIIAQRYRSGALRKRLGFNVEVDDSVPHVLFGDSEKLMQALSYLIDNAIKFTTAGEVNIRASGKMVDNNECLLSLDVTDTGSGVPDEHQLAVFRAFHKVDSELSNDGLGLGLAVCQHLVNLIGGTVSYQPGIQSGGCFRLYVSCQTSVS